MNRHTLVLRKRKRFVFRSERIKRVFPVGKQTRVLYPHKITVLYTKETETQTLFSLIAKKRGVYHIALSIFNLCSLTRCVCNSHDEQSFGLTLSAIGIEWQYGCTDYPANDFEKRVFCYFVSENPSQNVQVLVVRPWKCM